MRKAQLAGLASFSATNSPLGIAGSSSSRFVVPSPGTPYGAVVSPDAYSSNKRFFSDHSFDTGPGALRRRGATVSGPTDLMRSTSTSPYSTMGGLQMGGLTRQAMPGVGPSAGEETDVVSSDLPPWARTTIPPQGLAWSPDQTWQGQATNQAAAHHSNAGLRRRSSVDNMPYLGKGSWTSSQDTVAAAASAAAAFAAAQRPAAALAPRVGHEPPAWLTNRSVSHQQLSREQLLNWSNYFGDRSKFNSPVASASPLPPSSQTSTQSAPPLPPPFTAHGSNETPSSSGFFGLAANLPTDQASGLQMDLRQAQLMPTSTHTSPAITSPVGATLSHLVPYPQGQGQSGTDDRRMSGGGLSPGSSSNSVGSGLASMGSSSRRFSGQDPLDMSGLQGSSATSSAGLTAATAAMILQPQHQHQGGGRISPGVSSSVDGGGSIFDSPGTWGSGQASTQQTTPITTASGVPAWLSSASCPTSAASTSHPQSQAYFAQPPPPLPRTMGPPSTMAQYQQGLLSHHQHGGISQQQVPYLDLSGSTQALPGASSSSYEDYATGPGSFEQQGHLEPPQTDAQSWWQAITQQKQQQQQQQQQTEAHHHHQ